MKQITPQPAPSPAAANNQDHGRGRMTLANVRQSREATPDRILAYGVEGVGKSTFGSQAPAAIFLASEDGIHHLDVARFPSPRSWDDVLAAVEELRAGVHVFKTLVIDTIDWIESQFLYPKIRAESFGGSDKEAQDYARWYKMSVPLWISLLQALERLRVERKMEIIVLAHARVQTVNNPTGEDYSRFVPAFGGNVGYDVWKQWADSVLFMGYDDTVVKIKQKAKGSTGARVIRTTREAAFDAKTRYTIPAVLPLDYQSYAKHRDVSRDPDSVRKEIAEIVDLLQPDKALKEKIDAFVREAGNNAAQLMVGLNRAKALLSEKNDKAAPAPAAG